VHKPWERIPAAVTRIAKERSGHVRHSSVPPMRRRFFTAHSVAVARLGGHMRIERDGAVPPTEAVTSTINCPRASASRNRSMPRLNAEAWILHHHRHDTLDGVLALANRREQFPRVVVGEELTCYFPEDGCKNARADLGRYPGRTTPICSGGAGYLPVCPGSSKNGKSRHAVAHPALSAEWTSIELWHLRAPDADVQGIRGIKWRRDRRALHREAY